MDDTSLKIAVEPSGVIEQNRLGEWCFRWRVRKLTDTPLEILAARCPHGKFKSKELRFDPALRAAAGESALVDIAVACGAAAGAVVENAFLLLLAEWRRERWRIFARLKIVVDDGGRPAAETELITAQRAGFSGIAD